MKNHFLNRIVKENTLYFYSFFAFGLIAGVALIFIDKGDFILFFSERRSVFGDAFFRFVTLLGEVYVYFIALIGLLFYRYRYAIILPAIGVSVALLSYFTKEFFAHERPFLYYKNLDLLDSIQFVEGIHVNGGTTSFPSGHTMSAFAFYTFLVLVLPKKNWISAALIILALLVGVSRIYLVQHFLQDVVVGAAIGVCLGVFWFWFNTKYPKQPHSWLDKCLLSGRKQV